jgi:hypothetical protein
MRLSVAERGSITPPTEDGILLRLRPAEDQDKAAVEHQQAATGESRAGSSAESEAYPPRNRLIA